MGGTSSKQFSEEDLLYNNGLHHHYKSDSRYPPSAIPDSSVPEIKLQEAPKQLRELFSIRERNPGDDLYDGIPVFVADSSPEQISESRRSTKVSEVSSRLSKAGILGLGKAVEVLDTLGSSITNLNPNRGFARAVATKGTELEILAFEVANTIVKGFILMQSLSDNNIEHLKKVVLRSEGVQKLVSQDMDELLKLFAADKRNELKIFLGEVVRFGTRSRDPQWHNLDRYFNNINRESVPLRQLKKEAEEDVELLMTMVQHTAELYNDWQLLDRVEQEYQSKRQEDEHSIPANKDIGDGISILKAELRSLTKQVKILKKKSLWSRSLEEVIGKLVDIVHYLQLEINSTFSNADDEESTHVISSNQERLGPTGLSLHYANMILQIDSLVARSGSIPPAARNALYESLPLTIKSTLPSKIKSFYVKEKLTVTEIQDEMENTLQWLVPIATNTAKAHHGFGWVGEWANTGSELKGKLDGASTEVSCIETLHHANKEKTEAYILEQLLWLHFLANQRLVLEGDKNS